MDLKVETVELTNRSRMLKTVWGRASCSQPNIQHLPRKTSKPVLHLEPERRIVTDTRLLVQPEPIRIHRPGGLVMAVPHLVLDEVTRYLSWEHATYEQKLIDETEQKMTQTYGGIFMGIDWAHGPDDFVATLWSRMAASMQIPLPYLMGKSHTPMRKQR